MSVPPPLRGALHDSILSGVFIDTKFLVPSKLDKVTGRIKQRRALFANSLVVKNVPLLASRKGCDYQLRSPTNPRLGFTDDSESTEEAEDSYTGDYDSTSDSDFDSEDDGAPATSFVSIWRRKSQTHQPLFQTKRRWIPLITPRHRQSNHATPLVYLQRFIQPNLPPQSRPALHRLAVPSSFKTRLSLRESLPASDDPRTPQADVDPEGFKHSCYIYTQRRCSSRHVAVCPPTNPRSTPQGHMVSKSHLRNRFIA